MNKRRRKRRATHPKAAVRWLKTGAAAGYANVSPSTLEKLRLTGRGPVFSKLGRLVVYDIADLDRWIEARRCTSTSSPVVPMTGQGSKPPPAMAPAKAVARQRVARQQVQDGLE